MFDAHCDTLLKIINGASLHENEFDVSFKRLAAYGKAVQVFAIFNCGDLNNPDIFKIIELLKQQTFKSSLAKFCVTTNDIKKNEKPVSALVSLEGVGNTPEFEYDDIDEFYLAGVRIMSLTWNNDNCLCGGISENKRGVTEKGREILRRMKTLGMVLDVSHISDKGFYECFEIEGLRIIATHSNSRTVCPNTRNLTDDQFKMIIKKGGVVGVNTFPMFLNGTKTANVVDLIRHIEHFCSLGGEENIGLGADFDGIEFKMEDIDSCEKMNILIDQLAKLNYPDKTIRGIYCENFLKFFEK